MGMSSLGKLDALAPFDDNEDPDSDDNDDDDEDEDNHTDNNHTNSADDISLNIKGMGLTNDSPLLQNGLTNGDTKPSTADDVRSFFSCPTYDAWAKINRSQRKELLKKVIDEDLIPYPDKICHTYVHTCSAVEGDNAAVEEIADAIL